MTPGELFDLDEVERFGDPWHGLAQNGVGGYKIQLSNGGTHDAPPFDGGDSYVIKIPGQAPVGTSAADAADGMTWLNYAVMSGDTKFLYGKALGRMSWIYIDGAAVPWLATAEWNAGAGVLTVDVKRFGIFEGTPESYSYTLPISVRPDLDSAVRAGLKLRLDDVDSAGRQVVLTFFYLRYREWPHNRNNEQSPVVKAIFLLTLDGTGNSVTLGAIHKIDGPLISRTGLGLDVERYWVMGGDSQITGPWRREIDADGNTTYPGGPSTVLLAIQGSVNGSASQRTERVLGATLFNDVFEIVKAVTQVNTVLNVQPIMESLNNEAWWRPFYLEHSPGTWIGQDYYPPTTCAPAFYANLARFESRTVTGFHGVEMGGVLTKLDFVSIGNYWLPTLSPRLATFMTGVPEVESLTINGVDSVYVDSDGNRGGVFVVAFDDFVRLGIEVVEGRLTNRVYIDRTPHHTLYSGPVSAQIKIDGFSIFASAEPVTGQLVVDTQNPVCWV